ncbi:MAG: cytochrome c family protein [Robiginitomaculum sp.]
MSDLFFNKIAGAMLASVLGFIGINKFSGIVVHPDELKSAEFAYSIVSNDAPKHTEKTAPVPFPSPLWIASQNTEKGKKIFKKCTSCHNANNGGKNTTGPALWNIVGRPKGSADHFKYSAGMLAKGGNWEIEDLDTFLTKPKDFIPKTKMGFNGLKKEEDRAALIAYLRSRSDNPMEALTAVSSPVQPVQPVQMDVPTDHEVPMLKEVPMPKQETAEHDAPKTDGH